MAVIIRAATLADAEILSAFAIKTYVAAFGHSFEPSDLEAHLQANLSVEKFKQYLSEDFILLAESAGQLVGYLQFGATEKLSEIELHRLYVHSDFQGQGIGSRLIEAMLEYPQVKAAKRIVLDVWEHNSGARKLYERFGFEVVGKWTFVVQSGAQTSEDLIMVRQAKNLLE